MIGNQQAIIQWLFQQDREKLFEIKEKKNRRSLTQNAYYWSLVNELSNALRISKEECHFKMLKDYGQSEIISVRSDIDISGFIPYFEEIGKGTVNGAQFTHYKCFKRSSEMDSKEFSILLDGLRYDCEAVGIMVMTPEEIADMKRE